MNTEGVTKASFYTSFRPLCPGGSPRVIGCSRPGFPRGRKEVVPVAHVENAVKEFKQRGVNTIILLLSDAECWKFYNMDLARFYAKNKLTTLAYPIIDHDVPTLALMARLVKDVDGLLTGKLDYNGEGPCTKLAVHCSAGIGRTNLVGACLAAYFGPPWGFSTPQTQEQCEFAEAFWKTQLAANALHPNAMKAAKVGWKFKCQKYAPLVERDWRTSQTL